MRRPLTVLLAANAVSTAGNVFTMLAGGGFRAVGSGGLPPGRRSAPRLALSEHAELAGDG